MTGDQGLFASFIQAGFECSTHRYGDRRLDLLAQTRHDQFAVLDFKRLTELGIRTVRTGARWHLIEQFPGSYSFESLEPTLRAAQDSGVELIMDLLHFGWPDFLDVFDPGFPAEFGKYVRALAKYMRPWAKVLFGYAPVNEMSFLSWVAGDVANMFPHRSGEGDRLKSILARSAIAASEVLLNEVPGVRLVWPEPMIHIIGSPELEGDEAEAEMYRLSQFQAWDMVSGRLAPELGGRPEYLDILGVNFYDRNQWVHNRENLGRSDPRYRPFHRILEEVWKRYRRPLFVSETGTEGDGRAGWLSYICAEVEEARRIGIPVEGICLYPILNHPGWEDDRHCHNGLFDYADDEGNREIFQPLAEVILIQQEKLQAQ